MRLSHTSPVACCLESINNDNDGKAYRIHGSTTDDLEREDTALPVPSPPARPQSRPLKFLAGRLALRSSLHRQSPSRDHASEYMRSCRSGVPYTMHARNAEASRTWWTAQIAHQFWSIHVEGRRSSVFQLGGISFHGTSSIGSRSNGVIDLMISLHLLVQRS